MIGVSSHCATVYSSVFPHVMFMEPIRSCRGQLACPCLVLLASCCHVGAVHTDLRLGAPLRPGHVVSSARNISTSRNFRFRVLFKKVRLFSKLCGQLI